MKAQLLNNLRYLYAFLALFFFLAGVHLTGPSSISQAQDAPAIADRPACIGEALAEYVNTVLDEKASFGNIRLLSPAFNMTNADSLAIFAAMEENGARFNQLDGFAGNTYSNIPGSRQSAMDWYGNWRAGFARYGKSVFFTEFGDFSLEGTSPDARNPGVISTMTAEFRRAANDGTVASINYFNPFGNLPGIGNPDPNFAKHWHSDGELIEITGGHTKAGANSASPLNLTPAFSEKTASLGLGWTVEIVLGPDANAAAQVVNTARANGLIPILRLCVGDACPFADPEVLVSFLTELNSQVGLAYVIVGPNEPISESWAAPECGDVDLEEIAEWQPLDVPCNSVSEPEFHSLRPYPASPCDREFDPDQQVLLCGNDLWVKQVYKVLPEQGQNCREIPNEDDPDAGPKLECDFIVTTSSSLSLSFNSAEFPILGNTELVPNAVRRSSLLDFPTRMNEYASWYLNGVIQRAEEKFFTIDDITEALTYAGPIRKLIPQHEQIGMRKSQGNLAAEAINGSENAVRHNQIAACTGADGTPIPCYSGPYTPRRLADIRGNEGFPEIPTSPIFPYMPFSTTEDSVGQIKSELRNQSTEIQYDATEITEIVYEPLSDNPEGIEKLYFPHIEEVNSLGKVLQQSFIPSDFRGQGETGASNAETDALRALPNCEIVESRTNPGDKLYPEINSDPTQPPIQGTLSFTASFPCIFDPPEADSACLEICTSQPGEDEESCNTTCSEQKACNAGAAIPFLVMTQTPGVDDTWARLVAGSWGIFKRIFPKAEPGAPVEEILDIPGHSNALYDSINTGAGVVTGVGGQAETEHETVAGDLGASRPGSSAKIFFPHLGSVYDYFLKGIQQALRPQGFGEIIVGTDVTFTGGQGCSEGRCRCGSGACSVSDLVGYFGNDLSKATAASKICQRESGSNPFSANRKCLRTYDGIDNDGDGAIDTDDNPDNPNATAPYYDGATVDYSIGMFQINLLAHDLPGLDCNSAFNFSFGTDADGDGFKDPDDPPYCEITNLELVQQCENYLLGNVAHQIEKARVISQSGTNWNPWSAAAACGI